MKLAAGHWNSATDSRPLARAIDELAGSRPAEVVFVDTKARWGISLYLGCEVEEVTSRPSGDAVTESLEDEDEAVELANATHFGLVAGIWTRDGGRQLRMARRVKSGQVFINNYGAGGGVELPFGGVKSSGYGREKGFEALYGFTTLKTVAIRHG